MGKGRGPRRPAPQTDLEREAALHGYAVKLFDRGDGRAVDWPLVAASLFKAGFACLDEAKGDERARRVLRKIEGGAYNRLVGNPDDGTAYTSDPLPRPPAGPGLVPAHDHDMQR